MTLWVTQAKRLVYVVIPYVLLTVIAAFVLAASQAGGAQDFNSEFDKDVPIYLKPPESLLTEDHNKIVKISGSYSVNYESMYAHLAMLGETMTLEDLHYVQVHLYTGNLSEDTKHDVIDAGDHENSTVIFSQLAYENGTALTTPAFFSVAVLGSIKFSTDVHQGDFEVIDSIPISENARAPIVSFFDFNKVPYLDSMLCKSYFLPSSERILIFPLNDFRVLLKDESGWTTTSPVFNGSFLRTENYNFISAKPWTDSKTEGMAEYTALNLGAPCKVTVTGESLSSIKLTGFKGWAKIGGREVTQEKGDPNWEIIGFESGIVTMDVRPKDSSYVSIKVQVQGKTTNLIMNGKDIAGFWVSWRNNLVEIWMTPYIPGLLVTIIAGILGRAIIEGKKS